MSIYLRGTRSVVHKFNPEQQYWYDARIFWDNEEKATLVTYWKNPELAGIWEFHYRIDLDCFRQLVGEELIEYVPNSKYYTLSIKGQERLSQD